MRAGTDADTAPTHTWTLVGLPGPVAVDILSSARSRDGAQKALQKAEQDAKKLHGLLAGKSPKWVCGGRLGRDLPSCKVAALGVGFTSWKCNIGARLREGKLSDEPVVRKRASGSDRNRDPAKRAASRAAAEAKRKGVRKRPQSLKRRPSGKWHDYQCSGCAYKD